MTLSSSYFAIENDLGLRGVFSSLGAGVRSLKLNEKDLILELEEEEDYLASDMFYGKTLGRVAGRMPSAFLLNGKACNLPEDVPGICLHGGREEGYSYRDFKAEAVEDEEKKSVIFSYLSEDGEAGYPGNVDVKVIYSIYKKENQLLISFEAESDQDTYFSLSNHIYWNFSAASLDDYIFEAKVDKVCTFKENTLLVEGMKDIPSYLDLNAHTKLSEKMDLIEKNIPEIGTLDHTFRFKKTGENEPVVLLENDEIRLETYTDFDAINFYVDNSLRPWKFKNAPELSKMKRRAIAIEPQLFPGLDHILLKKGEKFCHYIRYKIITKE